jgi:hypothetical protein
MIGKGNEKVREARAQKGLAMLLRDDLGDRTPLREIEMIVKAGNSELP